MAPLMSHAPPGGRTLAAALTGSVRVAGTALPFWVILAPLIVAYPIMLAIGAATLSGRTPKQAAKTTQVAAPLVRPSAAPSSPPPLATAEPVAPAALPTTTPDRTSESLLSLAEARLDRERTAAKTLRARFEGDPTLLMD